MLTPEQRERRRKYIGSSDSAAIMGLDPYRSAADVWMDKTGKVEDAETNDAMEAGNFLEGAVLDWFERQHGAPLTRDQFLVGRSGNRCANLDAMILSAKQIVEAKTTGITGPADAGYGEPGTDELPDRVIVQTHHQFGVCGEDYGIAWVPVLIGGVGFVKYVVDRNGDLVEQIALQVESFWTQYVQRDIRPDDFRPSLSTLKRTRREPNLIVTVPDVVASEFIATRDADIAAGKRRTAAEAAMLTMMGAAEGAASSFGTFEYLERNRRGYVVEPTTFRQWKFPKAQKQIETSTPAQRERLAI